MAKTKAPAKSERSEKRILITGGTGFLGTHIVRNFLAYGETNLKVMASRVPEWMKDAGVKAVEGSVTDRDDVAKACKNVSAIFHLAGKVSRDNDDAASMNKIHLEGTRLLCEAATEAGVQTMVLASSSGTIAVNEDEQLVDETYPQPIEILTRWAYYASKYYQERAALENFNSPGQKLVIMNPSLLLGPDDERLSSTKPVLDFLGRKIPYCPSGGLNLVDARDAAAPPLGYASGMVPRAASPRASCARSRSRSSRSFPGSCGSGSRCSRCSTKRSTRTRGRATSASG